MEMIDETVNIPTVALARIYKHIATYTTFHAGSDLIFVFEQHLAKGWRELHGFSLIAKGKIQGLLTGKEMMDELMDDGGE